MNKTAIFTDIHGNYHAFKACYEDAKKKGCEEFWFLGDYIGEFAYPLKTMELIYSIRKKYPCIFIRGNKEDYWINYRKSDNHFWKDGDSTLGSLFYTYNNITDREIDFFETMPVSLDIKKEGALAITLCHASPLKNNRKLLPGDEESEKAIESCNTDFIFCGHSHNKKHFVHYIGLHKVNPTGWSSNQC